MMAEFLDEENLRDGLNDYLNTYKYGNADIKDLWQVFTRNTNNSIDVKVFIHNVPDMTSLLTI